eukprot:Rhum_TRINITY_DN14102_c0_g2::Rhum_TRINITY_DN14102_c0_g2_i1::g.69295::m.69295/K14209/SLC36A, PAT; solute carrier family 36 (proton-coupled amino acid transporter)
MSRLHSPTHRAPHRSATMPGGDREGHEINAGRRATLVGVYESFLDLASLEADAFEGERQSLVSSPASVRSASPSRLVLTHDGREMASVGRAFCLFLKSFIGGAILALPSAFARGGVLFTAVGVVVISLWNFVCMYLLYLAGLKTGSFTLGSLAHLVSPAFVWLTEISLCVTQCSFCVTYFLFFLDCFAAAVKWFLHCGGPDLTDGANAGLVVLCLSVILIPLCCIKQLEKLAAAALAADVLLIVCIAYVLGAETDQLVEHGLSSNQSLIVGSAFGQSVGTAIFAFEGVGMVLPVAGCMEDPSKFATVLVAVGVMLTLLYMTFGVMGAIVYGSDTRTAVLLNLNADNPSSPLPSLLQLAWCASILATFPIQLMPAVTALERVMAWSWTTAKISRSVVVLALAASAFALRNSFSTFLSLAGIFCCLPLAFLYPPVIHLFLVASTPRETALDLVLLVMGGSVLVFVAYSTFAHPAHDPAETICRR